MKKKHILHFSWVKKYIYTVIRNMIRNVGGGWRLREFKMEEGKKKGKKKKRWKKEQPGGMFTIWLN